MDGILGGPCGGWGAAPRRGVPNVPRGGEGGKCDARMRAAAGDGAMTGLTASAPLALFAVTPPGLEAITAAELAELGIAGVVETGGVAWQGPVGQLHAANLRLRTASRILVRV